MKLIDLINKMYKREVEIEFQFTLQYKEFTLNTYEIRECEYGLMIWDLDNDSRFDSNEYILDYLDYEIIKIIEEEKEIEELCIEKDINSNNYYLIDKDIVKCQMARHSTIIANKLNELIREVNKMKKEGK